MKGGTTHMIPDAFGWKMDSLLEKNMHQIAWPLPEPDAVGEGVGAA